MATTGLLGPFRLSVDGIDAAIPRRTAGAFALGYTSPEGKFMVKHVGRADGDVAARLRDCIGTAAMFKFGAFASSVEAFEKECEMFHDFRPPGNRLHPERPAGTSWECPRCRASRRR